MSTAIVLNPVNVGPMDEYYEATTSNFEANEDLYALFKALQRQEEFLDIQVVAVCIIQVIL